MTLTIRQLIVGLTFALGNSNASGETAAIPANAAFPYTGSRFELFGFPSDLSNFVVTYTSEQTHDKLVIHPHVPYIDFLFQGLTISGVHVFHSPFKWTAPRISVKLSNSTGRTLLFDEARFRVITSEIDETPIPWFRSLFDPGVLAIENDGWGAMEDTTVDLGVLSHSECRKDTTRNVHLSHFVVGNIKDRYLLNIPENMIFAVPKKEIETDLMVCAAGFLNYRDSSGKSHKIPFATPINVVPPPPGAAAPPSAAYELRLEAGKSNYTQVLPISQGLKAGDFDNFVVAISSDKSARFSMDLQLHATDDTILPLGKIELAFFRPKSVGEPKLAEDRYKPVSRSYYDMPELAGYITRVTEHPDNPSEFYVYVTGKWASLERKSSGRA